MLLGVLLDHVERDFFLEQIDVRPSIGDGCLLDGHNTRLALMLCDVIRLLKTRKIEARLRMPRTRSSRWKRERRKRKELAV